MTDVDESKQVRASDMDKKVKLIYVWHPEKHPGGSVSGHILDLLGVRTWQEKTDRLDKCNLYQISKSKHIEVFLINRVNRAQIGEPRSGGDPKSVARSS